MALCFVNFGFCAQSVPRNSNPRNLAIARWEGEKPAIEKTLVHNFDYLVDGFDVHVVDAFGSNDTDPSVALVDFDHGGAYTDAVAVMRMEGGIPVLATFRDKKGKRIPNEFLSGASVMHTVDVKLVSEKKAVYDRFADSNSEGRIARCGVKSYIWNPKMRTFDEDARLSRTASDEYCRPLHTAK